MDQIHGLGDLRAHRLAIEALDLTAELLAAIVPAPPWSTGLKRLRSIWNLGRLPILSPGRFLEDHDDRGADPLPASWDVTSDSIAARIAIHLDASRLILLKSRAVPRGGGLAEAASLGLVDPMFPDDRTGTQDRGRGLPARAEPVPQILFRDRGSRESCSPRSDAPAVRDA